MPHGHDNLFGVMDPPAQCPTHGGCAPPKETDITVHLNIATLGRILKVTQFHPVVRIVCDAGRPVLFSTQLGTAGSRIDIYVQPT